MPIIIPDLTIDGAFDMLHILSILARQSQSQHLTPQLGHMNLRDYEVFWLYPAREVSNYRRIHLLMYTRVWMSAGLLQSALKSPRVRRFVITLLIVANLNKCHCSVSLDPRLFSFNIF